MNVALIKKYGCKNCAHRVIQNRAMACSFNPPTAFPIMVADEKTGGPNVVGWVSSFPPVSPDLKCGKHQFVATYDNLTDEMLKLPADIQKLKGLGGR